LFYALQYLWRVSKGYRLRPWRSPYLRWRLETYFGVHADTLARQDFFRLLWRERHRLLAFLRWAHEMEREYYR
jgi:hypothetical protein